MGDRHVGPSIYITANSPGEVNGWALPVVERLSERSPDTGVTIVITPCQYASGLEAEVASSLPGVSRVVRMGELVRESLIRGQRASAGSKVLFLGGDPFYGVLLSKLLSAPAMAYMNKPRWSRHYRKYFVTDDTIRQRFLDSGIEPERVEAVGQLALDSVRVSATPDEIRSRLVVGQSDIVTFLPGSRPAEVRFMTPFFLDVAESLHTAHPGLEIFFAISPFADMKMLARAVANANARMEGDVITTRRGLRIRLVADNTHDVMSVSRLVVTIPGTNNLQLAAMGVPMLIVTPLNWAEHIAVDGILGLVNPNIPPFGIIKRRLLLDRASRMKYVSLPNTIAGRAIVPEMLGILQSDEVAHRACELLESQSTLDRIAGDMREITRHRGAADRIVAALGCNTP